MKSFKEQDIQIEEEMIEKLLNDTTHSNNNHEIKDQAGEEDVNQSLTNNNVIESFTGETASNNKQKPL
jgi:hypothetical protein